MAGDYAERTRIVVWRSVTGILSGAAVTAIGYTLFFAHGGLQRPDGYPGFGWSVAALLGACLGLCCLGIFRYAARLPQPERVDGAIWRRLPAEVAEIFANPAFRLLFGSAVVTFAALGLNATLNNHAFVFVWRLRSELIQFIGYAYLAGLLLGVPIAPVLQRFMEKKYVVVIGLSLLVANWLVLQGLRLGHLYAPLGDAALLPMQINSFVAGIGSGLAIVAYPSLMADAADDHEHRFGRRREGLYFAGLGFANKAASGLGVLLAGAALDLIHFPQDVGRQVGVILPEATQAHLVLIWGPAAAVVAVISMAMLAGYNITRARHAQIAEDLRLRRAGQA